MLVLFVQLRRRYKWTLLSGYVVGPLLAVLIMVVWPALMLLTGVMSCSDFARWTALVIVIAVISALLLVIVTPIAEFIKVHNNSCVSGVQSINQSIAFISGSMAHSNTRQTRQTGIDRQQ